MTRHHLSVILCVISLTDSKIKQNPKNLQKRDRKSASFLQVLTISYLSNLRLKIINERVL